MDGQYSLIWGTREDAYRIGRSVPDTRALIDETIFKLNDQKLSPRTQLRSPLTWQDFTPKSYRLSNIRFKTLSPKSSVHWWSGGFLKLGLIFAAIASIRLSAAASLRFRLCMISFVEITKFEIKGNSSFLKLKIFEMRKQVYKLFKCDFGISFFSLVTLSACSALLADYTV